MSPRAACRLATLGFGEVFDYMPGKLDWMARGLPLAGEKADEPRVVDFARADVVTCGPADTVGDLRDRVAASPYRFALVLSPQGVLLGRLRNAALQGSPAARADDVMEPGPSTTRPHTAPGVLLERLERADLSTALVSDPDGRLRGVVRRSDLESRPH